MSSLAKDKILTWFLVIFIEEESAKSALSFCINITTSHVNIQSFYDDDMKHSNCQVSFLSIVLKCISKSILVISGVIKVLIHVSVASILIIQAISIA